MSVIERSDRATHHRISYVLRDAKIRAAVARSGPSCERISPGGDPAAKYARSSEGLECSAVIGMDEGEPRNAPKTVVHGFVAQNAATAVVLRRGPARRTLLARWDLRTDTIDLGQWLIGRVEHAASGLSPNGELLVYSARKRERRFTAVSRPPYFTALAFWEERLPWTGGGFFVSDDLLVLGVTHPPDEGSLPRGLTVTDVWTYFAWRGNRRSKDTFGDAVLKSPEAHQGWRRNGRRSEKPNPGHPGLVLVRDGPLGRPSPYRLAQGAGSEAATVDLGVLDWADWQRDGSLLFGQHGRLHRQRLPDVLDATPSPPALVADLTGCAFERIIAPESARRWPRRAKA